MKFDDFLCAAIDVFFTYWPQRKLTTTRDVKLVSHRGEHNTVSVPENTLAAFDAAKNFGAWGIELDVRWTKDGHPVIIHDSNCKRVFGCDITIAKVTLAHLKERVRCIPTLCEVIERYGSHLHLMVELKKEPYQESFSRYLYEACRGLTPCKNFHILSLDPDLFAHVHQLPSTTFLPVAWKDNVAALSRTALENSYGGITGHYMLLNDHVLRAHKESGQSIGTGFIASGNCLCREVHRGVQWHFTNSLQKISEFVRQI